MRPFKVFSAQDSRQAVALLAEHAPSVKILAGGTDLLVELKASTDGPAVVVDITRAQIEGIAKMQIQVIDAMMDTWEEEIKSPSSSAAILSKLKSLPGLRVGGGLGAAGTWPSVAASQMAAFNPFGAYMQIFEQWQKAWTEAMAFWAKAGKPNGWRAQL